MQTTFESLSQNTEVRAIVLSGEGKHFCAGIDISVLMNIQQFDSDCEGRKREMIRDFIIKLQNTITAIEKCKKPVLAAIHNGCIGGAVDIVSACDMRYATEDAYFVIKEVDMGLVADIGTLQRLPKIIPHGIVNELAFTGRKMYGEEAKNVGLTNATYADKETMIVEVTKIAETIAAKSPLVIRGTKEIMKYTRDHSVEDSLNYVATWNAAMLISNDIMIAMQANMMKTKPEFEG
ncbi:UNVERIFIED_CONTAM: hypothetical protein GTU68_001682 [Idotea baltica]|nr:hypothetical protein [Idotea baltica]